MTHRLRRGAVTVAVLVVTALVALTAWGAFLLWPRDHGPVRADAVVMLAGADDGRHRYARDLVDAGYADTLLVSNPSGNDEPVARELCSGDLRPDPPAEVVCFSPEPRTTWGEARAVARIAELRGWSRLVVVTNRPHALRAGTWMRGATGLDVHVAPIGRVDLPRLPVHVVREVGGFVKGWLNGHW